MHASVPTLVHWYKIICKADTCQAFAVRATCLATCAAQHKGNTVEAQRKLASCYAHQVFLYQEEARPVPITTPPQQPQA